MDAPFQTYGGGKGGCYCNLINLIPPHSLFISAFLGNGGDVVLDPFAGVGTTCKAAKMLGRQWIGVDVNSDEADKVRDWLMAD